ncbi:MAG: thiol reductant ABC exporter subunit CydD, partial [Gaiella sp.]
MQLLDPRLVARARPVRVVLAVDVVLGFVVAVLVLAQAVLLARVAAQAFEGASLGEVREPLALLLGAVMARAVSSWGFEVAGRRAAGDVLSLLRLDLTRTSLSRRPVSLDGVRRAEVTTAAVAGV